MTKLPVVSAREAVKAFEQLGYEVDHQTGSHVILRQTEAPHRRLTVPNATPSVGSRPIDFTTR